MRSYATVFRNENALMYDYIPENFPFREGQIELIANIIKGIEKGKYKNMLLYGPHGTGKTGITKFFFRELKYSTRIVPIYFNCYYDHKKSKIYHEINKRIGNIFPPSGISNEIMFDSMISTIKAKKIIPLIALDEVDQLCIFGDKEILYQFLRVYEKEEGVRIGMIMIINDIKSFLPGLDHSIKGVMNTEEIVFPQYSLFEIKEILKRRSRIAFHSDAIGNDVMDVVSEYVYEQGGDIRLGLDILRNAGYVADKDGKSRISVEIIEKILSPHKMINYVIERLDDYEKKLIDVIKSIDNPTTGKVYEILVNEIDISYATFCKMIRKLENLRIIDTKLIEKRGKTREIYLRI